MHIPFSECPAGLSRRDHPVIPSSCPKEKQKKEDTKRHVSVYMNLLSPRCGFIHLNERRLNSCSILLGFIGQFDLFFARRPTFLSALSEAERGQPPGVRPEQRPKSQERN